MEGIILLIIIIIVSLFVVDWFSRSHSSSIVEGNEIGVLIDINKYLENKYDYSYNGGCFERGWGIDHYYWIVDIPSQSNEKTFGQDDTGRFWDINRLEEVDSDGNPIKYVFKVGQNEQNFEKLIFTCKADYSYTNGGAFGVERNYYPPDHTYQFSGHLMIDWVGDGGDCWFEFIEEKSDRNLTIYDGEIIMQKHGNIMINIDNIDYKKCLFKTYAITNGPVYYKEIIVLSSDSKPYLWWVTDKLQKKENAIAYEDSYGSLFYVGDEPNIGYCEQFMGDKSTEKKIKIDYEGIFILYTKGNSGLGWINCEDL